MENNVIVTKAEIKTPRETDRAVDEVDEVPNVAPTAGAWQASGLESQLSREN